MRVTGERFITRSNELPEQPSGFTREKHPLRKEPTQISRQNREWGKNRRISDETVYKYVDVQTKHNIDNIIMYKINKMICIKLIISKIW